MFEALFLGLLQGLTEFLPISSSAHLRLAGEFLPSASDPGATLLRLRRLALNWQCSFTLEKTLPALLRLGCQK